MYSDVSEFQPDYIMLILCRWYKQFVWKKFTNLVTIIHMDIWDESSDSDNKAIILFRVNL